jgi:hypothetical protein
LTEGRALTENNNLQTRCARPAVGKHEAARAGIGEPLKRAGDILRNDRLSGVNIQPKNVRSA